MKIRILSYEYAHHGTNYMPTERFGSFTCTVLPLPHFSFHCPLISHCSYILTVTHSHAGHPMIAAHLIQLESSKAMLHLQDVKPICGYKGV